MKYLTWIICTAIVAASLYMITLVVCDHWLKLETKWMESDCKAELLYEE